MKCKKALDSKYQRDADRDSKLKFYKECEANQAVAKPIFTKI